MTSLNLWVKPEPFTLGCVPLLPHPRLTPTHLKRIISYLKNKGHPSLRYSVWKHIACHKLQLPDDLTQLYFDNYILIHVKKAKDRIDMDLKRAACKNNSELECLRNDIYINTRKFVLLLFLQYIHKDKLRSSHYFQEEWSSYTHESARFKKDHAELKQLCFIKSHLEEIMDILKGDDKGLSYEDIPEDCIEPLELIIEGSADGAKTTDSVYSLALLKENHKSSGYILLKKAFKQSTFLSWLKGHLGPYPFGFSACIASGIHLNWCDSIDISSGDSYSLCKKGKLITNATNAPSGKKIIFISEVCRQTVARTSSILHGSTVKLHLCQQAYFYLLSPIRYLSVHQCHDCTLVLGPIATTLVVSGCKNLRISAVVRRIMVRDSSSITFFIMTPNRPLILGDKNTSISLAPYNTIYPTLEQHMKQAGLIEKPNFWYKPYCLSAGMKQETVGNILMPVEEFFIYSVPFEMEGPTKEIPGGIPQRYEEELKKKEKRVAEWHMNVRESRLTKKQREQLQSISLQKFQEWLVISGYQNELISLSQYQKDIAQKPPVK